MNNAINLLELSIIRKRCNKKRYQTLSVKQYKLSSLYNNKGGCVKMYTSSFYAQSPDFLKPGLCYFLKFLYL